MASWRRPPRRARLAEERTATVARRSPSDLTAAEDAARAAACLQPIDVEAQITELQEIVAVRQKVMQRQAVEPDAGAEDANAVAETEMALAGAGAQLRAAVEERFRRQHRRP